MSPFFGHSDDRPSTDAALQAEAERLEALTLPQLAVEVMVKGFGPGTPGAVERAFGGAAI